jgi:predicted O-methyltransferase YrrM
MEDPIWTRTDRYLEGLLVAEDPVLTAALQDARTAGLPTMQVSPLQGSILHLLARTVRATKILEVGTLGGYSTIWLARALPPEGRLISLELSPAHAEVARRNLERAGLASRVAVRVGAAKNSLVELSREGAGPFDLVFIDADKSNNLSYFESALGLTRPGSLIVIDNVGRGGAISDPASSDPSVVGTRQVLERMGRERRVVASAVQTVGGKGYDGFAIALVVGS